MLTGASTRAVAGLDGAIVEVEVGMSRGLPTFSIVLLVSSTEGLAPASSFHAQFSNDY